MVQGLSPKQRETVKLASQCQAWGRQPVVLLDIVNTLKIKHYFTHIYFESWKNQTLEVCVCPTFVNTTHFLRLLQRTAFYPGPQALLAWPVLNCVPQSRLSLTLETRVKDSSCPTRREYWTYILHWRNKSKSHRSRIQAFLNLKMRQEVDESCLVGQI